MNENAAVATALKSAIDAVSAGSPRSLVTRTNFELTDAGLDFEVDDLIIVDSLLVLDVNDPIRKKFHFALLKWDADEDPEWSPGTEPYSRERRDFVLTSLGLSDDSKALVNDRWPTNTDRDVVISGDWERWYDGERQAERAFYWPHYREMLTSKGWSESSLASLDSSTNDVVRRLSDPLRVAAYQSKGLVVGYVQSGKTAHFTGTIAKAIDAGYRLVIVFGGTLDLLRNQTQRRLDMELVGVPGILGGKDPDDPDQRADIDYLEDDDWLNGRFVTHGGVRPSEAGYPDIRRLTGAKFDFQLLRGGLDALDFRSELRDKALPIFHRENLFGTDARLIVIKKNPSVLRRLVKDLRAITASLDDIPTLVIDDESDQASVSTVSPSKQSTDDAADKLRTATNAEITKILGLLPRAQYVGYTATPFANVFVDPEDSADIFPKDFVLSLKRPEGYMGASDFHDFDDLEPGATRTVENSNQLAHVRDLFGSDEESAAVEMTRALDSFVLTGALKLFRRDRDPALSFRHHTMLIHESTRQAEHLRLAEIVEGLWHEAGFSTARGLARLENLWRNDFEVVSAARASHLPSPTSFQELESFVSQVVARVTRVGPPVLIVNGDKDVERYRGELDFDTTEVWRVLVGGTKLSRGFTVEGLTISYYKRRSLQADTLMQMGRWFGFRPGYEDLVRLFIDRANVSGKKSFDLYEAFESMVIDEESFRDELRRYAELTVGGKPVVTPRQIPPLVTQHLPWLQPTSRNKRYNAVLVERGDGGQLKDLALLPSRGDGTSNKANFEALRPILVLPRTPLTFLSDFGTPYTADVCVVDNAVVVQALESMVFDKSFERGPQLTFLRRAGQSGLLTDWAVVFPTLESSQSVDLGEFGRLSLAARERRTDENRVGFSGSSARQRPAVRRIAGVADTGIYDPVAASLSTPTRGALLVTPILDAGGNATATDARDVALLLSYVAPLLSAPKGKLGFSVLVKSDAAIVDIAS